MASSDLDLIAGTSFGFSVTWQQRTPDGLKPVDISGCTALLQVRDVGTGALLIEAGTGGRGIEIPRGVDGHIDVTLAPDASRDLQPRRLGEAAYELRVYFPSGDVCSVLPPGFLVINQGVIRD